MLGDCWFLAASSAVAMAKPDAMKAIFANVDANAMHSQGLYTFNFWTMGVPSQVYIDDYLPLRKTHDGTYKGFFARASKDGAMWPLFLEKAFAKNHGNYLHIEGGSMSVAVNTLTGMHAY